MSETGTTQHTKESIETLAKYVIRESLGLAKEQVRDDARITEDLGADSLDRLELQLQLEEEFKIEMPDSDGAQLETVGHLVQYIQGKVPHNG